MADIPGMAWMNENLGFRLRLRVAGSVLGLGLLISTPQASGEVVFDEPVERQWQEVFERVYSRDYRIGRCGGNILELLREAKRQGLDLRGAQVVRLKNEGNSIFGMVNAEWARESGAKNPTYPKLGPSRLPGEKNWDFHVFLKRSKHVYDLDFGNDPVVPNWTDYLEKMFLKEPAPGTWQYVGRNRKLSEYQATLLSGEVFLQSNGAVPDTYRPKMVRLKDLLEDSSAAISSE